MRFRTEEYNYFSGVCSRCAERYEAHSATDDLTGINFHCKKLLCTGTVTLRDSDLKGTPKNEPSPFVNSHPTGRYS